MTKSGRILTDEVIEELAERVERGEYPGESGKMLAASQGARLLDNEELVVVSIQIPRSLCDRLDQAASGKNETRSQFLREALEAALA